VKPVKSVYHTEDSKEDNIIYAITQQLII